MATLTGAALVTYAQSIVCNGADTTLLTEFAMELLERELPRAGWKANYSILTLTAGTSTVALSATMQQMLAAFHQGRELSRETVASLDSLGGTWQNASGAPRYWTQAREDALTLRVHPTPQYTSTGGTDIAGSFDYLIVLGMFRNTTIPLYLRLPAALWILSREYARESRYRDTDFAKIAQALAERLLQMIDGVAIAPAQR